MDKKRIGFSVVVGAILMSLQIVSHVYVSDSLNNEYIPYDINNNEVVNSYFDNSLYMIKTVRGYYGVVNSNGVEIISPVWNSVEVLTQDRFVVGRVLNSASVSVGILDDYENMIVPMIFNSISQENDYFRIGTLTENGKKVLFDHSGTIQLYKEWDSYELDGNIIKVKTGDITAVVTADNDGVCSYTSLYIPSSILGKDFSVTIKEPLSDGVSALDDYCTVVDSLSSYCEAIFNSDTDAIRKITNSQYYNSLISNMLPNCSLNHISSVSVYGSYDTNGSVIYHAEIRLAYTSKTVVVDDSFTSQEMNTIQINMEFVRSQEGEIVLRSAEKILYDSQSNIDSDIDSSESPEIDIT